MLTSFILSALCAEDKLKAINFVVRLESVDNSLAQEKKEQQQLSHLHFSFDHILLPDIQNMVKLVNLFMILKYNRQV